MLSLTSFAGAALVALAAQQVAADCVSYGVDFHDGGSYFQNSLSSDPFTFVSQFEGCQNDTAYNILVDPNADQYLCSDTNLLPDNTDQLSACPENKDQLWSGDWSVVVMSNNGNGTGFSYQRDFYLEVGPQQTTTYTPTVVFTTTTTPMTSTTSTQTYTVTEVAPTLTTTVPSKTVTRTYKVTPRRQTTTVSNRITSTKIKAKVSVIKTTKTVTPICHLPTVDPTPDKTCRFRITVASVATPAPKMRFERDVFDKEAFLKERRDYLSQRRALQKREPDQATITVTDTNTSDYPTSTLTVTEPTITATYYDSATTTTTSTPPVVTVMKGKSTAPAVTTTLPTPTRTISKCTVITTTVSTTYFPTVTITKKTTPGALKRSCRTAGGILY